MRRDRHILAAQNADARLPEQLGDRSLDARPGIVIAQAAVNSERRAQAAQRVHHGALRIGVEGDEVAGQDDQVGFCALAMATYLRICGAVMNGPMWMSESWQMRNPSKARGRRGRRMVRGAISRLSRP